MFRMYPGSLPGIGLLLLRVALGVIIVAQAVLHLKGNGMLSSSAVFLSLVVILSGLLLLLGFLIPLASLLGGLVITSLSVLSPDVNGSTFIGNSFRIFLPVVVSAAIAMLGPGAFSFDAHLFGHRKVIIPERKESK